MARGPLPDVCVTYSEYWILNGIPAKSNSHRREYGIHRSNTSSRRPLEKIPRKNQNAKIQIEFFSARRNVHGLPTRQIGSTCYYCAGPKQRQLANLYSQLCPPKVSSSGYRQPASRWEPLPSRWKNHPTILHHNETSTLPRE